jgi:hypothetical protein
MVEPESLTVIRSLAGLLPNQDWQRLTNPVMEK